LRGSPVLWFGLAAVIVAFAAIYVFYFDWIPLAPDENALRLLTIDYSPDHRPRLLNQASVAIENGMPIRPFLRGQAFEPEIIRELSLALEIVWNSGWNWPITPLRVL
jgi:hypothetical protein